MRRLNSQKNKTFNGNIRQLYAPKMAKSYEMLIVLKFVYNFNKDSGLSKEDIEIKNLLYDIIPNRFKILYDNFIPSNTKYIKGILLKDTNDYLIVKLGLQDKFKKVFKIVSEKPPKFKKVTKIS